MANITNEELQKAKSLYNETKSYQYGSIRAKSAKKRYDAYTNELATKYGCNAGAIHSKILIERRKEQKNK